MLEKTKKTRYRVFLQVVTTSTITRHYWHLFTAVRNAFIFISHKRNSITSAWVFGKIEKPIHASLAHAGHLQKAHIYVLSPHR